MSFRKNNSASYIRWMLILGCCSGIFSSPPVRANPEKQQFFIIDSYIIGWATGLCTGKGQRWKCANELAARKAKNDAKIWGGLFVADTNKSKGRMTGEILSRFTYEFPQTLGGFMTAQFYNTYTKRVNTVDYRYGATVMNMNVNWPGVSLGSYILADDRLRPDNNNKLFQHEYGHYLQSQRMGWAYLIRVGLPAIMSKGDHDRHPVEVSCNAEAWMYFHSTFPDFKNDDKWGDTLGWNYYFNPFPDSVGERVLYKSDSISVIDVTSSEHLRQLEALKVKATFMDYFTWIFPPAAFVTGVCHSIRYNKEQALVQGFDYPKH